MKTVILLGAGFSRAMKPRASIRKRPPLDKDFFDIARKIRPQLTKEIEQYLYSSLGEMAQSVLSSLEETACYLFIKAKDARDIRSEDHLAYLKLLKLLQSTLRTTTNDSPTSTNSVGYRFLSNELKKVNRPEDLSIITFNYDLCVEKILARINQSKQGTLCFPYCYRLNRDEFSDTAHVQKYPPLTETESDDFGVGIYKLHGSMNWASTHQSKKPIPSALYRDARGLTLFNCSAVTEALFRRKKRKVYIWPVIVPPVSGKKKCDAHFVFTFMVASCKRTF